MEEKKQKLLLGGHISLLDGIERVIAKGESLGFTAIQCYLRSDQEWVKHTITAEQIAQFKDALQQSSIEYVIALDPYMKHLGTKDKTRNKIMCELIADELTLCELLNIPYLIIHPGICRLITTIEDCITTMSDNLNEIFEKTESTKTKILLQNMPSRKKSICYSFEQLARLYHPSLYKERLGFCFDMCNAFATNYEFGIKKQYEAMWQKFDNILGLNNLKVIHINDSQEEWGSGIGSRAFITKGCIPVEAYRLIMNDDRFFAIPKIIEIPAQTLDDYKEALQILKDFLYPYNRRLFGLE